jgi:ubiquinone/menaquinone biosynthesis C-methylase UbiE
MMEHTYPILYKVEESHWWYRGRRKIIAGFVSEIVSQIKGRPPRILDVGCGTGANLFLLSKYGEVEGVDVSPDALNFCRERGFQHLRLGEAEKLPYEDESFDLVTAFDVVEHLDDDVAGLREFSRVLRKGGRVLLFVPTFMFLWGLQDEVSNHRRRYRLPELHRAVSEAGLEVERTTYANITFFLPIWLVRTVMRLTGVRTSSENNVNINIFNAPFGWLLGTESNVLRHMNLPFGVSGICVARKPE